jgi:hypothetical protein
VRTTADRVTGLVLGDGSFLEADIVVTAVTPGQVFSRLLDHPVSSDAVRAFSAAKDAPAATRTYLGLSGGAPVLPAEVVLHGDPLVIVATGSSDDTPSRTWTVTARGPFSGDLLDVMAQRGVDVRSRVETRLDRSERVDAWDGARRAVARAGLSRPLAGRHCLGTGLVLGSTIPYVAWQAAHVADAIGKP